MLGFLAAGLHWFSGILIVIGLVTSDGSHSAEWETKYPDWTERYKVRLALFSVSDPPLIRIGARSLPPVLYI